MWNADWNDSFLKIFATLQLIDRKKSNWSNVSEIEKFHNLGKKIFSFLNFLTLIFIDNFFPSMKI